MKIVGCAGLENFSLPDMYEKWIICIHKIIIGFEIIGIESYTVSCICRKYVPTKILIENKILSVIIILYTSIHERYDVHLCIVHCTRQKENKTNKKIVCICDNCQNNICIHFVYVIVNGITQISLWIAIESTFTRIHAHLAQQMPSPTLNKIERKMSPT